MTKLTPEEHRALLWLSKQKTPMWRGIYTHGNAGDSVVASIVARDLITGVARPSTVGKAEFSGGYVVTKAGRASIQGAS